MIEFRPYLTAFFRCLRPLVLGGLFWGRASAAPPDFGSAPEVITNLAQISRPVATNVPSRRLVQMDLPGTVLIGGNAGGVAVFDGSSAFQLLPHPPGEPWRRGQRIQLQGHCLVDGGSLFLTPRPLIENDGLHAMFERSAGLWLAAGRVPLRVRYFNRTGDRGLVLAIEGPGLANQTIPDAMLCHPETNPATGAISWKSGLRFQCYEGAWGEMPDFGTLTSVTNGVAGNFHITASARTDNFGLVFEGCLVIPRPGFYHLRCTSDDGSLVDMGDSGYSIRTLGETPLPPLPRLAAGQSLSGETDNFCAALEGVVTLASRDDGGLQLELSSGRGRARVWLPSYVPMDPQWLMGLRVLATGVCQSVFVPEGYPVAGELTVYSEQDFQVLEAPWRVWDAQPLLNTRQIAANSLTNPQPQLVRLRGVLVQESGKFGIADPVGEMFLSGGGALNLELGSRVEAMGVADVSAGEPTLRCYALRQIETLHGGGEGLPLLTTVAEIKQMNREEAQRGYPVKVRGVVTFLWPGAGFFLQDATWSIDVRMATNATGNLPQLGDYCEVEGKTFVEFAPDIMATRATRLGPGAMPSPEHPNWTQLIDGSLDTQYIEVQGVVLSVNGTDMNFLTTGGRVTIQMQDESHAFLASLQGALIRVRGCLIPGRDVFTQQVRVGELSLRNTSVAVVEPAPPDPFALPLKHATDLLLYDSHASPTERAKIGGIVLQQRNGVAFIIDRRNGVRIVLENSPDLHPGDRIEAVGFPDLTGPAPVFNSAVVRCLSHGQLPEPVSLAFTNLMRRENDSTRVSIVGTLISQRVSGPDQVLEMRSGTRPWQARLVIRSGVLPGIPWESELKLTGVYVGQGGDRSRGRDIDAFDVLLNSPMDVQVLHSPTWWTARHALNVAFALLAVLLLAAIWIWALRRQVEERTHALKSEIEDHKQTELELEKKTRLLTKEIEERLRIETEVDRGHKQLLITSRLAGMAEVATSVLHNVGNVMTSVNVLSSSIVDLVRNSKIPSVARLGELLGSHRQALDHFVTQDERGRKIPEYVTRLGSHLADEQSVLLQKVRVLNDNIHHINEIVSMQQAYAKVSGVLETLPPEDVAEDALRMHGESLRRHGIKLVRDFERLPPVTMDRHKILQILFNLLENAKYACLQATVEDKKIIVALQATPRQFLRLTVTDNGMGIPPENLARIFRQGFSTRKDGHGFGLHSSVLAAQDMGGSLTAHSEGPGKGAAFVLEIPLKPPGVLPAKK